MSTQVRVRLGARRRPAPSTPHSRRGFFGRAAVPAGAARLAQLDAEMQVILDLPRP